MLVIGILCPVGEKTRIKMSIRKQRYLVYVLGEKFLTIKNREYGADYVRKLSFVNWKFSRIIRPTPVINSQDC